MADVMLPTLLAPLATPEVAKTTASRPTFTREGSSVRFRESPPRNRPTFARQGTSTSTGALTVGSLAPLMDHAYPPTTSEAAPRPPRAKANILGWHTNYKPLVLLAAGSLGNALYGTGTVALKRGVWPVRDMPPPGLPPPAPYLAPLFGSAAVSIGLGATATGLGVLLAAGSSGLFYLDARRLARRQNAALPNYVRPSVYWSAHLFGIGLSAGGKFLTEVIRDRSSHDYSWATSLPGIVGQAIFAVTLANSASTCELLNGRMPLAHRSRVGFAARFSVGAYTVWAAMQSVPNFSPYGREGMRIFAQVSLTVAYALPLTTARLGRHQGVDFVAHQPKPSWYSLQVLGLYIAGRVLAGFGPDMVQRGLYQSDKGFGWVYGGTTALTAGGGACIAALMLFRQDVAAYNLREANLLFAGAAFAFLAVMAYVGLAQYAGSMHDTSILWAALVPGVLGAGLRLAILPSMYSFSELRSGDLPLKDRLYWVEGSRSIAAVCFGAWGVMSAQPDVNVYLREAVAVAAGSFATLGMALPTTTSRRALPQYAWPLSPGATPSGLVDERSYGGFPFPTA